MARRREQSPLKMAVVIAGGCVLGALLTKLMEVALPPSGARRFLITTVAASLDRVSIDLGVIAASVGPLVFRVNFLSVVGIILVAWFVRSLL